MDLTAMDLTTWLEYFAEGLSVQMSEVQEKGKRVIRRDIVLSKALRAGIKERPIALLAFLLDKGKGTVAECKDALNGIRRTLPRDIRLLGEKGFLMEVGTDPTDPKVPQQHDIAVQFQ